MYMCIYRCSCRSCVHSACHHVYTCTCTCTCSCVYTCTIHVQGCGNIEPIAGHFGLFLPLLSCSPYTLYTVQFRFTGHSLDLSDNVLHDWLYPHPCTCIHVDIIIHYKLQLTVT